MPLIRPFAGLRPAPEYASEVIAPPYDVLNTREARAHAAGRPWSFLHISKPEIDLPEGADPYASAVYEKGVENFRRMQDENILLQDKQARYYIYGLTMGTHQQTGLVAAASLADYNSGRIRKHELTRPDKEDDRVRQIDSLNAQTGPVLLAYKQHDSVEEVFDAVTRQAPLADITADDGVVHKLWAIDDAARITRISTVFDRMDTLYIADGHHRSAAASRVASRRSAANPAHTGEEAYNYFLAVLFPDRQMQILAYNRAVKDLNGLSQEAFIARVSAAFEVTASAAGPVKPVLTGEFGMYLGGQWYRLLLRDDIKVECNPVACLEVSLLADNLIVPILDITDPRRDKRILFIGGIRGLDELENCVNSGEMAVAFSLRPTRMADLTLVADAGKIMPPKSTWFEPKLADGLVSHLI
ncbi:MAG: DUF1015 domain-containing protein [Gammaproteobacteria bacterium]|nr:DUF1015 domain-containing protein [Gammaproteobacteria bacterium]